MMIDGILKKCCALRPFLGHPQVAVAVVFAFVCSGSLCAMERVSGANATLDIEPGARSAALGSATMAIDGDYLGLMSNPYQLSGVHYTWASFSHTAYYEDTKYDYASVVTPLWAFLSPALAPTTFPGSRKVNPCRRVPTTKRFPSRTGCLVFRGAGA